MSTRKTEDRDIGDLKVTTIQLPAMRGSRLRLRLLKMLSPLLGALEGKKLDDVMKLDVSDLAPAIMAAASQLDDATHDALILQILLCTSVQTTDASGKQIRFDLTSQSTIDQAFGGDVDALWSAAKFALEVNLGGNFFRRDVATPEQAPSS